MELKSSMTITCECGKQITSRYDRVALARFTIHKYVKHWPFNRRGVKYDTPRQPDVGEPYDPRDDPRDDPWAPTRVTPNEDD